MTDERLSYLFNRYRARTCTNAERQELALLCLLPEKQAVIEQLADAAWEQTSLEQDMHEDKGALILQRIMAPSFQAPAPETGRVRRLLWRRVAVAASIIFIIGLGGYFMFFNKGKDQQPLVAINNDVPAPSSNKAVIKLPDGKEISIDSLTSYTQGSVTVTKTADGRVVYTGFGDKVVFNTLTNPKGSKVIDIELADKSHVWLNAGSSITYPVAFTGNDRKVSMTGEAFFKVAYNTSKPFTVTKGNMDVTVLGTEFNVNAYDDEDDMKVTLLQGSVKTKLSSGQTATLKPGQQANVGIDIKVVSNVDVDAVMAWKNGFFQFNRSSVQDVMRQVARWYDVDIAYEGRIPERQFGGKINRNASMSQVLRILEESNVHFKIDGRKITVLP